MQKGIKWRLAQRLELWWWRNYLRNKNKAAYLAWKQKYWLNLLQLLKPVVTIDANTAIADIGCGPAGIFIALPANTITAVDPLLNRYQRQLPFFNTADYPHVTFINCAMEDYLPQQQFNLVFCLNAVNHVHDIEQAFDVLKNSTVPGGQVVLSIDAHNHNFFKNLFRLVPGDLLHPQQHSLNGYKKFLSERGFQIVQYHVLKREFLFTHYVLVGNLA